MGGIHIPNPISAAKDVYNGARDVVNTGADVVSTVADKGADVVSTVADKGAGVVSDGIHLSEEALHDYGDFELNIAKGAGDWATGLADTFGGIVEHPVDTLKTVGKMATNPLLNPVAAIPDMALKAAHGDNPLDAYKDGANQIKDIGVGLYDGYKDEYKKHGIGGLIGNAAPDVAIAILTDGGSAAAEGGAEAVARGTAESVVRETAEQGAKDVVKAGAKGLLPDEKTGVQVVNQQRQQDDKKPAPAAHHK